MPGSVWSPAAPCGRALHSILVLAMLVLGLLPSSAHAETMATFDLSAEIVAGCAINGVEPVSGTDAGRIGILDYGQHSALATGSVTAAVQQNGAVIMQCTPSVSLTMAVDGGRHADGGRQLQAEGSSDRLTYALYRDAGFTGDDRGSVTSARN